MRYGILAVLLGIAVYVFLCGCGMALNLASDKQRVYGGVGTDLRTVAAGVGLRESTGFESALAPFAVLDLPLSLVCDTLILPWTVTVELKWLFETQVKPEK